MDYALDYSLFPHKEEWGTGDEAMDNRLSVALKKVQSDLTFPNISEFYFYGMSLKPRTYNPAFSTTIELVTKAFLFYLSPDECINHLMQKVKGDYFNKTKIKIALQETEAILSALKKERMFRYKGQIDFYLQEHSETERNPFVKSVLKRSKDELHTKIIMKDFKVYLNGEKDESLYEDVLFRALRKHNQVLEIENLGQLWYHQGQIFSLLLS